MDSKGSAQDIGASAPRTARASGHSSSGWWLTLLGLLAGCRSAQNRALEPTAGYPERRQPDLAPSIQHGRLGDATRAIGADLRRVVTTPLSWYAVGGAVLVGELKDGHGLDRWVSEEIEQPDNLSPELSSVLDKAGEGYVLLTAAGVLFGLGVESEDPLMSAAGADAVSALVSTGLVTLALKVAAPDNRPNGATGSFPSGHSSMSMAFATTLHEHYGWAVSAPLFALTGAIAYQRIDSGAHEFDDVLAGLALGWAVARELSQPVQGHERSTVLPSISPFLGPSGDAFGLRLSWQF